MDFYFKHVLYFCVRRIITWYFTYQTHNNLITSTDLEQIWYMGLRIKCDSKKVFSLYQMQVPFYQTAYIIPVSYETLTIIHLWI
jgi:hypothetical protein